VPLINIMIDSRVSLCPEALMLEFSIVDLLRDLKTVVHAAAREPVGITQHRKATPCVDDGLNIFSTADDQRKACRVDNAPPALASLLAARLDRLLKGRDDADGS